MSFNRWLRANSEHYLLRDSQTSLSRTYGLAPVPADGSGLKHLFWTKVFVPTYRLMPWPLRRTILQSLPGSHRQTWTAAPRRNTPAV